MPVGWAPTCAKQQQRSGAQPTPAMQRPPDLSINEPMRSHAQEKLVRPPPSLPKGGGVGLGVGGH